MKKFIILLLVLVLGSCSVSNKTYNTNSVRHPVYINSTSKVNPYVKNKDKNSYEKTYKKHISKMKLGK